MPKVLGDLFSGAVSALVTLAYAAGYAALIFAGPLADHAADGLWAAAVTAGLAALVVALAGSFPFSIAGPDSNATAVLAVAAAGVAAAGGGVETVLMALALSAAVAGLAMWVLGRAHAGRMVKIIPQFVVGGFLAGTGYLIGEGVIKILTGRGLGPETLGELAAVPGVELVTTAAVAAALLAGTRLTRSPALIPAVIVIASIIFWGWLWLAGMELAAAREKRLLFQPFPAGRLRTPFHLEHSAIRWTAIAVSIPHLLLAVCVTVLTVLVNARAIGMAIEKEEVDFDRELAASGAACVLAGLAGGMIGYLSLTRSLLAKKAGARSRAAPALTGLLCLASVFLAPQVFGYVPRPVLSGILLFLGMSLMVEWLLEGPRRMPFGRYLLVLAIFAGFVWYKWAA